MTREQRLEEAVHLAIRLENETLKDLIDDGHSDESMAVCASRQAIANWKHALRCDGVSSSQIFDMLLECMAALQQLQNKHKSIEAAVQYQKTKSLVDAVNKQQKG